jgi:hypothetical protein
MPRWVVTTTMRQVKHYAVEAETEGEAMVKCGVSDSTLLEADDPDESVNYAVTEEEWQGLSGN